MDGMGTCRFCKQTMIVEGEKDQQAADNYATMHCKCKEGMKFRNIEDMKSAALENAKSLFVIHENAGEKEKADHEKLINLMSNIINSIADGIIEKCSIKVSERTSASIFITAKDGIRIRKDYKEQYVLEANHY